LSFLIGYDLNGKTEKPKKQKQVKEVIDPILFKSCKSPKNWIVTTTWITGEKLKDYILEFIKTECSKLYTEGFGILFCFKQRSIDTLRLTNSEKWEIKYRDKIADDFLIKKDVTKLIDKHKIDFKKYIKPGDKVIVDGHALRTITNDSSMQAKNFKDYVFNETYFYHPDLCCHIFPVFAIFLNRNTIYRSFEHWYFKYQVRRMYSQDYHPKRISMLNSIRIEDPNEFLLANMDSKKVAWDIETSGFNFQKDKIICITMSFDGKTGYYLDWNKIDIKILSRFFKNKYQIGANLKFDVKFLRHHGVKNLKIDFDTYLAGHVLDENRSNSLKSHAWYYTNHGGYDKDLEDYKKKYKKITYDMIPIDILFKYATMDSIITFQVYEKMLEQLNIIDIKFFENQKNKLSTYYFNIVLPSVNAYCDMEYEGMYIDWNRLETISIDVHNQIEAVRKELAEIFNIKSKVTLFNANAKYPKVEYDIKLSSDTQLGKLLEQHKFPCHGRTKRGDYLVNDDSLTKWIKAGYKEAELIQKLHELRTIHNTFIGYKHEGNGYWQYRFLDDLIHANFGVMVNRSGRNNCKNPNLQNIPKHNKELSKLIRSIFKPPSSDYYLVEADASGFQLRICASLSDDANMKDVFINKGGDLHSMTAVSVVWNNKYSFEEFISRKKEHEFDEARFRAKAVNFSLIFNTAGLSFAEQSIKPDWTIEAIDDYLIKNDLEQKPSFLCSQFFNKGNDKQVYKTDEKEEIARKEFLHFCKYWAVALNIKAKFFETYPKVREWIDDSIDFAKQHGYIVSPFGGIRRLSELLARTEDKETKYDKLLYIKDDGRTNKKLENIACNTIVQNFEVVLMNITIFKLRNYIKENGLKTKIVSNIHDAIIMYVHKDEIELIYKKAKEFFEEDIPENNGIPQELEFNVADYSKGETLGFGKEMNLEDIKKLKTF